MITKIKRNVKIGKSKHFNKTFSDLKEGDNFFTDDMPSREFLCSIPSYKNDEGELEVEIDGYMIMKEKYLKRI